MAIELIKFFSTNPNYSIGFIIFSLIHFGGRETSALTPAATDANGSLNYALVQIYL